MIKYVLTKNRRIEWMEAGGYVGGNLSCVARIRELNYLCSVKNEWKTSTERTAIQESFTRILCQRNIHAIVGWNKSSFEARYRCQVELKAFVRLDIGNIKSSPHRNRDAFVICFLSFICIAFHGLSFTRAYDPELQAKHPLKTNLNPLKWTAQHQRKRRYCLQLHTAIQLRCKHSQITLKGSV